MQLCETHNSKARKLSASEDENDYSSCMETFGDRLARARMDAGYDRPADAIEAFGFSSAYYGHEKKEHAPRRDSVQRYAKAYRVDFDWLNTGVERVRKDDQPAPVEIDTVMLGEILHLLAHWGFLAHERDPSLGEFGEFQPGQPGAVWIESAELLRDALQLSVSGAPHDGVLYYLRGATRQQVSEGEETASERQKGHR